MYSKDSKIDDIKNDIKRKEKLLKEAKLNLKILERYNDFLNLNEGTFSADEKELFTLMKKSITTELSILDQIKYDDLWDKLKNEAL